MIYSDTERKECPFCDNVLIPGEKEGSYECEGCKTLIVDTVCPTKSEPYTYTDILGYEKEVYDIEKYNGEDWMYYRKLEAMMHYRNITRIDDEGEVICPVCNRKH
jgi:RNA polymerase subunit RPABC4/transcription elongation factor Spt4